MLAEALCLKGFTESETHLPIYPTSLQAWSNAGELESKVRGSLKKGLASIPKAELQNFLRFVNSEWEVEWKKVPCFAAIDEGSAKKSGLRRHTVHW